MQADAEMGDSVVLGQMHVFEGAESGSGLSTIAAGLLNSETSHWPYLGGEQQNSSLCDGSPLLLRDFTATKKELQGSSKHSKMPKNQPDQMAGTLQKQVLPGSHIGFAERPFFLGLAPGHLEKFRFQRHPAIETHCLARTGWGSNPREK